MKNWEMNPWIFLMICSGNIFNSIKEFFQIWGNLPYILCFMILDLHVWLFLLTDSIYYAPPPYHYMRYFTTIRGEKSRDT